MALPGPNRFPCIRKILQLIVLAFASLCISYITVVNWSIRYLQSIPQLPDGNNPHNYSYLLQPRQTICEGKSPDLVIGVTTSVHNFYQRTVIRDTWASVARDSDNIQLLFFVGASASSTASVQKMLEFEQNQFDDIVQENFLDTYLNLSLKSVALMKWVSTRCPNSKFVLKVDDDVYLNVANLLTALKQTRNMYQHFVFGALNDFAVAGHENDGTRDHLIVMTYPYTLYPPYITGPAYAMPVHSANLIYQASLKTLSFRAEDVYINGFLAQKAGISIVPHDLVSGHRWPKDGCTFKRVISGHSYQPKELLEIHENVMMSKTAVCEQRDYYRSWVLIAFLVLVIVIYYQTIIHLR